MKRSSKKGFTLAELLIVIAIIAVLVAIMIPVFGAQLTKANAAADLANVRAKYAELVAEGMMGGDNDISKPLTSVNVDIAELAKAMNNTSSTVKYEEEKDSSTPAKVTKKTITVELNGYKGSFEIDLDVNIGTNNGGSFANSTSGDTYKQDGTKSS